jgi:hypothetical protein
MNKLILKAGFLAATAVVIMSGVLAHTSVAHAQSVDKAMKYGDAVTGAINSDQTSFTYTFTGKAKDFVAVHYAGDPAVKYDDQLHDTQLSIADPKGKIVVDSTTVFNLNDAFAFQLLTDGTYTITATRKDGSDGTATGQFMLTLDKATILETGKELTDTATAARAKYYVVSAPTKDFAIEYLKQKGDLIATVDIYTMGQGGALDGISYMSGSGLAGGSLIVTVDGSSNYLVTVSGGLLSLDKGTVNYKLSLADVN